jgi:glutamyl-tRNA synthetase
MVKKRWKEDTPEHLKKLSCVLKEIEPFTSKNTEEKVKQWLEASGLSMGQVMTAFRLAVVGAGKGPHMFDIIALIGKEETIKRIEKAVETIKK